MKLREPTNGYDFEAKAAYREAVWKAFAENVSDVSTAKVLFFPGREGLEIDVALRHGFKEENLVACDENAALLARAKWRQQYPQIRCYGNELRRVVERMEGDRIVLDAANLDFCSNLSDTIYDGLKALLVSRVVALSCVLAVTVLKGRENLALTSTIRATTGVQGVIDRIGIIRAYLTTIKYCSWGIRKGEYRSGTKNMAYAVWLVRPDIWLVNQYQAWIDAHLEEIRELGGLNAAWRYYAAEHNANRNTSQAIYTLNSATLKARTLHDDYKAMQTPLFAWCARDRICEDVENWHLFTDALAALWGYLDISANEQQDKMADMRKLLIKSEQEKAQLLQAGRSWK